MSALLVNMFNADSHGRNLVLLEVGYMTCARAEKDSLAEGMRERESQIFTNPSKRQKINKENICKKKK